MRIRVLEIADGWRRVRIRLPLNAVSRNPGGVMFGGFQASLADPIPALACARVFPGYSVWTRAMTIEFEHGGSTDLELRFEMSPAQEAAIRSELERRGPGDAGVRVRLFPHRRHALHADRQHGGDPAAAATARPPRPRRRNRGCNDEHCPRNGPNTAWRADPPSGRGPALHRRPAGAGRVVRRCDCAGPGRRRRHATAPARVSPEPRPPAVGPAVPAAVPAAGRSRAALRRAKRRATCASSRGSCAR